MDMSSSPLSFKTRISYGFGDLGNSAAATVIPLLFLFYLTDVAGISPGRAGLILLICKIWDAVIDPFIGTWSDHLKHRFGRRRPFFMWSALPFGLLFGLLWSLPSWADAHRDIYVMIIFLLFNTAFSFIQIPYNSLNAQLTSSYNERTLLTTYRMAFSIGAGILFSIVPIRIIQAFPDPVMGYRVMGWSVAAVLVLSPLVLFLNLREDDAPDTARELSFMQGFRVVLRNKPFWSALTMFLFSWMALDILAAMLIYYIKYWLNQEALSDVFLGLIFITAAVFLPVWLRVSEHIGKKSAYIWGASVMCVSLMAFYTLPRHALSAAFFFSVTAGIGVSAIHVLPWSIIPDVVEYDELKSGQRREGLYSGFASLLRQLSTSFALFIVGMLLDYSGYQANAVQSEQVLSTLRLIIGPIPTAMYLISIVAIVVYPIDYPFYMRMQALLIKRRSNHDA